MTDCIRLIPVEKEYIWGMEYWCVSAYPGADCIVQGGVYDGRSLSSLWKEHREIFGNRAGDKFPLLTKIIVAREDLSIQVHPDDDYARAHENGSLGKNECWYILSCAPGTTIIIGHNAKDKAEMEHMIRNGEWKKFLREIPLHDGDFFQINAGTVHAIKGGSRILETQQNSDITYRVYDYGRKKDGKPRQLHVEQSIACIRAPFVPDETKPTVRKTDFGTETDLVACPYYALKRLDIDGSYTDLPGCSFEIASILKGEGEIGNTPVSENMHMIIPFHNEPLIWKGKFSAVVSHPV